MKIFKSKLWYRD